MAKTAPRTEKRLRVTTDVATRVHSAGIDFAGITELPLAQFSAAQLVELKADKRLEVEEIDVTVED